MKKLITLLLTFCVLSAGAIAADAQFAPDEPQTVVSVQLQDQAPAALDNAALMTDEELDQIDGGDVIYRIPLYDADGNFIGYLIIIVRELE